MQEVGDVEMGYSVAYEGTTQSVNVLGRGFWTRDIAASFTNAVLAACRTAPPGARLALDMTDLKPMREEGQSAWKELLNAVAAESRIARVVVTTGNALTRLQLIRLSKESQLRASRVEWVERTPGDQPADKGWR